MASKFNKGDKVKVLEDITRKYKNVIGEVVAIERHTYIRDTSRPIDSLIRVKLETAEEILVREHR